MRNLLLLALVGFSGCATLSDTGEKVRIVSRVDDKCKNLGPVNVSVTGWGMASEKQNVLRNNTADLGGNVVILNGDDSGIAYQCAADSKAN